MSENKLNLQEITSKLTAIVPKLQRYSLVAFIAFVALLYGFIAFKISSLGSTEPSQAAVTSQVNAAQIPRIDQSVVKQLQSLQDNSVSVQTLFNQARNNPFQ